MRTPHFYPYFLVIVPPARRRLQIFFALLLLRNYFLPTFSLFLLFLFI